MLSYRHAFHAGNFADLLKHSTLIHTLTYMTQKDKALRIIDTHAGAGGYALTGQQPIKNREYDSGIGALWQLNNLPPLLSAYQQQVKTFNPEPLLRFYPGSPLLAQALMRQQDRLFLHELHSTDCRLLKEAIGRDARVKIIEEDGFSGMQALLPPPDRRALVLLDPSYEIKSDYQHVIRQLVEAYKRFATGTFLLWYPVVMRQRIDELERALKKSGIKNIQLFEWTIAEDTLEHGMTGSGMIVINPPWTLWKEMESALPFLTELYNSTAPRGDLTGANSSAGHYRIEQLVAE